MMLHRHFEKEYGTANLTTTDDVAKVETKEVISESPEKNDVAKQRRGRPKKTEETNE